jgi:hypothetical protein
MDRKLFRPVASSESNRKEDAIDRQTLHNVAEVVAVRPVADEALRLKTYIVPPLLTMDPK